MQEASEEREKAIKRANQVVNEPKTSLEDQPCTSSVQLEKDLAQARAELTRSNKNWERRFGVLRASLHEIKDEAYIRKRIEVLPMSMHTAKVNIRRFSQAKFGSRSSIAARA